jgi:hypothetical protein
LSQGANRHSLYCPVRKATDTRIARLLFALVLTLTLAFVLALAAAFVPALQGELGAVWAPENEAREVEESELAAGRGP